MGPGGFDGGLDPIEETVAVSGVSYIGWTFRVRPGGSQKISFIAKESGPEKVSLVTRGDRSKKS